MAITVMARMKVEMKKWKWQLHGQHGWHWQASQSWPMVIIWMKVKVEMKKWKWSQKVKVTITWSAWMTLTSFPELATPPTSPSPHGITTGSTAWESINLAFIYIYSDLLSLFLLLLSKLTDIIVSRAMTNKFLEWNLWKRYSYCCYYKCNWM